MLSFFQHYMIRATSLLIFHLKQKPCHIISCSFFHHPKPTSKWLAFEAFKLISLWSSSCLSQPEGDQQGLWIFEFFALAENCALQRKISLFHAKLLEPKPFRFFSLVLMNIHVHESVKGLFCEQVATTLRTLLQSIVSSSNLVIIVVGSSWKETFMTSGARKTPLECTLPMDKIPHQLIHVQSFAMLLSQVAHDVFSILPKLYIHLYEYLIYI